MKILVVYLLLIAQVVLHEYWHARALRAAGVRVVEAGLGMALPPRYVHTTRSGFRWSVSIWLLGAYVRPHKDDWKKIEQAPYTQAAWQFNAGITINLVTGLLALGLAHLINGRLLSAAVLLGTGIVAAFTQKQIAAYVMPAIGPLALALFAWVFARTVNAGESAGMLGMATLAPPALTPAAMLSLFGALGLALALLNAVPLAPLDNGRVWDRLLTTWFGPKIAQAAMALGFGVVGAVTVYAVGCDIVTLLT